MIGLLPFYGFVVQSWLFVRYTIRPVINDSGLSNPTIRPSNNETIAVARTIALVLAFVKINLSFDFHCDIIVPL
jgi:hypothetical protein